MQVPQTPTANTTMQSVRTIRQCMTSAEATRAGERLGRRRFLGLAGAAMFGCAALMGGLAPEPDPVPRRWELQFDPGPLRVATVNVPEVGPRSYLYLTYRVTNNSGQDVFFAPAFDLADGEGNVLRSGRDVPQSVTTELLGVIQNSFAQDQVQIIGDILQGEQHAKDGLVIWPLKDLNPSEIVIYATGMSGESKTVIGPDGKSRFVVRKTVRLEYVAPGMLDARRGAPIDLRQRSWIMR